MHLAHRSDPIAGKPGSHNPGTAFPCGSGLARDAGNAVHLAHRSDPIAGKPGSHNPCAISHLWEIGRAHV